MSLDSGVRAKPVQHRSEQTVKAILNAADMVFAEVGVAAATTTVISERAGISVGSLYRFYSDKAALAQALADRYLEDLLTVYLEVDSLVSTDGVAAIPDAVDLMVHRAAELFEIYPGYAAVVRHLSPARSDSPAHHVRSSQIEALMSWFARSPNDLDVQTRRRIAEFLIDTTRVLLERMPDPGPERDAHVDDVVVLLTAYVQHHLG